MEHHQLGEYIRQRRVQLGLTQSEVCNGICEPISLSRLENGRQTPSRSCINAILQRLGLPASHYCALLSRSELEIEALKKEIVGCNTTKQTDMSRQKLEQLAQMVDPDDHLTQQFILRTQSLLLGLEHKGSLQDRYNLSLQALRMTVPQFETDRIGQFLYTTEEIKLINQLSVLYSRMGDNEKAADIGYQLLEYIQDHFDRDQTIVSMGMLPLVLYHYVRALDLCGHYAQAAALAQRGLEVCAKYHHYQFVPNLLELRGECLHFLGRDTESAELYRQSYYTSKIFGIETDIRNHRREAREYLGLILED